MNEDNYSLDSIEIDFELIKIEFMYIEKCLNFMKEHYISDFDEFYFYFL